MLRLPFTSPKHSSHQKPWGRCSRLDGFSDTRSPQVPKVRRRPTAPTAPKPPSLRGARAGPGHVGKLSCTEPAQNRRGIRGVGEAMHQDTGLVGLVLGLESIFRTRFGSNPKLLVLTGLNSLAVPVAPPVL